MKYCVHCGAELDDAAAICIKCGKNPAGATENAGVQRDGTLVAVIKFLMILSCIVQGFGLIPLIWCIPITVSIFKAFKEKKPIGTGIKVCTLLFVNMIAGICLLIMKD